MSERTGFTVVRPCGERVTHASFLDAQGATEEMDARILLGASLVAVRNDAGWHTLRPDLVHPEVP